jgi:hypothetical protein
MRVRFSTKRNKPVFTINEQQEAVSSIGEKSKLDNGTVPGSDLLEEIAQQLRHIQPPPKRVIGKVSPQPPGQNSADISFNIITELIPILDSMERTLDLARAFKDNELLNNWITNIAAIHRKLRGILIRYGLKEIETIGEKVDFSRHEVVEYRQINDFPENIIIEEKQRGYQFQDKIIRDAKVVVAKSIAKI